MCNITRLDARGTDLILRQAAALVAVRTGLDEDDLRSVGNEHVPRFLADWTPTLGVPLARYLRRRAILAMRDAAKRVGRRGRFHGDMPAAADGEPGDRGRTLWSDGAGGGAEAAEAVERRVLVARLLACVSARERRVLTLRFRWGWTNEEIARELRVSVGTVERDTAKAIEKMRKVVAAERAAAPAKSR